MFKIYLKKALALFAVLGFLFIPLTFFGFDYQYRLTRFLFLAPVAFIQDHFFPNAIKNIEFSSDSISLNILLGLLFILSFLSLLVMKFFRIRSAGIIPLFKFLSAYYMAAVLLKYGFDKVFKRQFYLPEPNILYSSFGSLTKDTLFWSTMGTSHLYSVATGFIEVITGLLILYKRTRIAGFCIAIGIVINIFLINIGFDISVKVFTLFLLMVLAFNLYPALKTIYAFFIQQRPVQLSPALYQAIPVNKWIHAFSCAGIIGLILFPYISLGILNDDKAERPFLHGAYQIEHFLINNDSLNSCDFPYTRFFIHRNSYIIFQKEDGSMTDYFFTIDPAMKQIDIHDYDNNKVAVTYNNDEKAGALQLIFGNKQQWTIQSRSLNWKVLPALQNGMHFTIDEIK
jgi:hypothetical protein